MEQCAVFSVVFNSKYNWNKKCWDKNDLEDNYNKDCIKNTVLSRWKDFETENKEYKKSDTREICTICGSIMVANFGLENLQMCDRIWMNLNSLLVVHIYTYT